MDGPDMIYPLALELLAGVVLLWDTASLRVRVGDGRIPIIVISTDSGSIGSQICVLELDIVRELIPGLQRCRHLCLDYGKS